MDAGAGPPFIGGPAAAAGIGGPAAGIGGPAAAAALSHPTVLLLCLPDYADVGREVKWQALAVKDGLAEKRRVSGLRHV
jgi:hypothetical protein